MDYQPYINEARPEQKEPKLSWNPDNPSDMHEFQSHRETAGKGNTEMLKEFGVKTFALIGIVAVLALVVWGSVQLMRVSPNSLTAVVTNIKSVFVGVGDKDAEINFSLTTHSLTDSEPFTLTWTNTSDEKGVYLARFECVDGISFETRDEVDRLVEMQCDVPFPLVRTATETGHAWTFTPYATIKRFSDVNVTVTFIPEDENRAAVQSNTLLTIVNEDLAAVPAIGESESTGQTESAATPATTYAPPIQNTPSQPATTGTTGTAPNTNIRVSDPNGTPDLALKLIAIGYTERGLFIPSTEAVTEDDRPTVRFSVENIGTKTSAEWTFEAKLPIQGRSGTFTYKPESAQQALRPGERIEFTLGFDDIKDNEDSQTVEIVIDPNRRLDETNRNNNTLTVVFKTENN